MRLRTLLAECGWRVEVGETGPKLVRATADAALLDAATKAQLTTLRGELVKLHTPHRCDAVKPRQRGEQEAGACGAEVYDAAALCEANETGVGAGCPFAHCPYRG